MRQEYMSINSLLHSFKKELSIKIKLLKSASILIDIRCKFTVSTFGSTKMPDMVFWLLSLFSSLIKISNLLLVLIVLKLRAFYLLNNIQIRTQMDHNLYQIQITLLMFRLQNPTGNFLSKTTVELMRLKHCMTDYHARALSIQSVLVTKF